MRKILLLGCGHRRQKILVPPGTSATFEGDTLLTLDENPLCHPDILCDLDTDEWDGFHNSSALRCGEIWDWNAHRHTFDEIHAYEVLEHFGVQGDYRALFSTFWHIWNLLKPNGYFCGTTPSRYSPWLWGDPGHRRVILPETLTFLCQPSYEAQIGRTALSDYRGVFKADFNIVSSADDRVTHAFILQAVKPSRYRIIQ